MREIDMNDMSEEERRAAEERIRRIREGGQPAAGRPSDAVEPGLDDSSDALSEARARVQAARESLEVAEQRKRGRSRGSQRSAAQPVAAGGRSLQGMLVIGGVVVIGLIVVVVIIMLGSLLGGGGSPLAATATPEPSATVPATDTPVPTGAAPTDSSLPTGSSPGGGPELALPPLACLFQDGVGCFDYCQDPAHEADCNSARQFVSAQNADPDVWLNCVAPGPGPNVGDPQSCLEEAWRANNP
jgi:hypothetical protein